MTDSEKRLAARFKRDYDDSVARGEPFIDALYYYEKHKFLAEHPDATPEEIDDAIREIIERVGI